MIRLLARLFIANRGDTANPAVRRAYGVLCGAVGHRAQRPCCLPPRRSPARGDRLHRHDRRRFQQPLRRALLSAITLGGLSPLRQARRQRTSVRSWPGGVHRRPDRRHADSDDGLRSGAQLGRGHLFAGAGGIQRAVGGHSRRGGAGEAVHGRAYNAAVSRKIQSVAMRATAMDSLSDAAATLAVLALVAGGSFPELEHRRLRRRAGVGADPAGGLLRRARYHQPAAGQSARPGIRQAHRGDRERLPGDSRHARSGRARLRRRTGA